MYENECKISRNFGRNLSYTYSAEVLFRKHDFTLNLQLRMCYFNEVHAV